jgi:hypothetical protein
MSEAKALVYGVNPILVVRDMGVAVAYYEEKLGFRKQWGQADYFACVARGNTSLFLSVWDQGQPGVWVWIGTNDVIALHAEFVAAGAVIRHPPTNYDWALEMQVADPDGNVLRFGSDPIAGKPYGPWLDMHGRKWMPDGEGWKLV